MEETFSNSDFLFENDGVKYEIITDKYNLINSYFKISNKNNVYRIGINNPKPIKITNCIIDNLIDFLNKDDYILDNNNKILAKVKKWNKILFDLNTELNFYLYIDYKLRNMYKYKTLYKNSNTKRLLSKGFLNIKMKIPNFKEIIKND